jgi:hypothetical protein
VRFLLEVKTVPFWGAVPGPTIKKVPADFAALLSADWPRTLVQVPDKYSGLLWAEQRARMDSVHGLQLMLIHGEIDLERVDAEVRKGITAGVAAPAYRYRHSETPRW